MTAPAPFPNAAHVLVRGNVVVITSRAPHLDSWRYVGVRADLTGDAVHFDHEDAQPIPDPTRTAPTTTARDLIANAGLNVEVFDEEQAALEADMEIARAESAKATERIRAEAALIECLGLWHHGYRSDAELHETYTVYAEAQ